MWKNTKFYVGLCMLMQSMTFFVAFFALLAKKKSLAKAFLGMAGAQGALGLFLIYKNEADERAAMDAFYDYSDEFDDIDETAISPARTPLSDVPTDDAATESDFK